MKNEAEKALRKVIDPIYNDIKGRLDTVKRQFDADFNANDPNSLFNRTKKAALDALATAAPNFPGYAQLEAVRSCLGTGDAFQKVVTAIQARIAAAGGAAAGAAATAAQQRVESAFNQARTNAMNAFNAVFTPLETRLSALNNRIVETVFCAKSRDDCWNPNLDTNGRFIPENTGGPTCGYHWLKWAADNNKPDVFRRAIGGFFRGLKQDFEALKRDVESSLGNARTNATTALNNWRSLMTVPVAVPPPNLNIAFSMKELGQAFLENVGAGVAVLKCVYDLIAKPAIARAPSAAGLKLPSFAVVEKAVRTMIPLVKKIVATAPSPAAAARGVRSATVRPNVRSADPRNVDLKTTAEQMMKDLLDEFVKNVPKVIAHFEKLRDETRAILTLDGLRSPDDDQYDPVIREWLKRALAPLQEPFANMLKAFEPMKAMMDVITPLSTVAGDLMMTPFVFMIRQMIYARSVFMEIARKTAPVILNGAVAVGEVVAKMTNIPDCMKRAFMDGLNAAFEVFGGPTAVLIEALDMKDTTVRILDSILGALDSVEGTRDALKKLAGNRTVTNRPVFTNAKAVFGAWDRLKQNGATDIEEMRRELTRRYGNVKRAFTNCDSE